MKKNVFLLVLILSLSPDAFCQPQVFFEASAAYPIIPNSELYSNISVLSIAGYSTNSQYKLVEEYNSEPGFEVIGGIHIGIGKSLSLKFGAGVTQNYFKRQNRVEEIEQDVVDPPGIFYTTPGEPGDIFFTGSGDTIPIDLSYVGNIENLGKTNITYLTVPLSFHYAIIERLSVGLGINPSILLYSKQIKSSVNFSDSRSFLSDGTDYRAPGNTNEDEEMMVIVSGYEDKSGNGLTNVLWQGNISVDFRLIKSLWITAQYQHSFTPIYDETDIFVSSDAKYRTFKLGLKYNL